ncbi:MAG: hypothetical protein AAFV33_19975 [Chloroflexota bacterium]
MTFRNFISGAILVFVWGIAVYWLYDAWYWGFVTATSVYTSIMAVLVTVLFINERFELRSRDAARPGRNSGKRKRSKQSAEAEAKMRALLELMDEDEREAFKAAMKQRMLDGASDEAATFAELMRRG